MAYRNEDFSCNECLEQYSEQLKSALFMEAVDEDQFLFPNKSAIMAKNTECGICSNVKTLMVLNCCKISCCRSCMERYLLTNRRKEVRLLSR